MQPRPCGLAEQQKGQKWNKMNILQLFCAEEITCSFITLGLRAGRGSRDCRRIDGAPEGDPPSGRQEAGMHSYGPGSPSPNSLQNFFSGGGYLMAPLSGRKLAFTPLRHAGCHQPHTLGSFLSRS